MHINIQTNHPSLTPTQATPGAAGFDLHTPESVTLRPGRRVTVNTTVRMDLPSHIFAEVRPRSGLATRGVDVLAGVVDADYRGPIKVILINHSDQDIHLNAGDRIAQIIFRQMITPYLVEGDITDTARGDNGFGSTGMAAAS